MTAPTAAEVTGAVRSTYAAFCSAGIAFASWASRIPQIRDSLGLSPSELGTLLLSIAGGSLVALPLAGRVIARYGSRRTVSATAVVLTGGLAILAVGYQHGIVYAAVGLFVLGWANGLWDVAMNVQGALVENHLGKSIMPRFHAGYSVGTVAGALVGAAMVALKVSVTVHLVAVAVVLAVSVPLAVRGFLADTGREHADEAPAPVSAAAAWREPRTLLIGLFVLAFAFAEGTGNDWVGVATIDGYHTRDVVGTLALAAFLTAMTISRWFGPTLLDRYGRVAVVRGLAGVSVIGLALFVFGGSLPVAFVGTLLWGAGVSLGFPVGMSAGADDARLAPARVSVVASIGYCAFLGGPPLIGFLGDHVGALRAVTAVAVLMALSTIIADTVRTAAPAPTARTTRVDG